MVTGGRDVRSELSARLRADPRVIAALRAKEAQHGRGFSTALNAQELAALGYEVEPDWVLVGNPTPRDGKRDFENTAALSDPSSASRTAVKIAAITGMTYGAGTMLAPAAGPAFTGNAVVDQAAIEGVKNVAAPSIGRMAIKYGLQYGLPTAINYLGARSQANAERDSNRDLMAYYDKALEAEKEERDYRRGFDEEGRRYGRYADSYGRDDSEERLRYGRAGDTYGRLSDEERLWYDRAQDIRSKNYGYQQYGNFVETLEPFRASGSAAVSRMSGLLGGPTPADTGSYLNLAKTARDSVQAVPNVPNRPTWDYTSTRPTWNYPSTGGSSSGGAGANAPVSTTQPVGGGPTITMQTPGGQTFTVTPDEVAGYEQRGAVQV